MKATGVVRRLDDLGRLVIPKEIRKQYRLKEGDSIEFFIENDRIIIQKHDVFSRYMEQIEIMIDTLKKMYGNTVLFMQEEWLKTHHHQIEEGFESIVQTHRILLFENQKVFQDQSDLKKGCIFPIVSYGDYYGAFVMIFDKEERKPEDFHAVLAYCELLSRQQEQ